MASFTSFVEETTKDVVDSIDLGETRLVFDFSHDVIFVAATHTGVPVFMTKRYLNNIIQAFISEYEEEIKKWKGELDIFLPFEEKLEKMMLDWTGHNPIYEDAFEKVLDKIEKRESLVGTAFFNEYGDIFYSDLPMPLVTDSLEFFAPQGGRPMTELIKEYYDQRLTMRKVNEMVIAIVTDKSIPFIESRALITYMSTLVKAYVQMGPFEREFDDTS